MSDIFEPQDEISIVAENFELDHQDHTHINSRLNYLSDIAPLHSRISLNMALTSFVIYADLEPPLAS